MTVSRLWAGNVFGTNLGKVFVELNGDDLHLAGVLRFNDSVAGIVVFSITGTFSDGALKLSGAVAKNGNASDQGKLQVSAKLLADGSLKGTWEMHTGEGGTLVLFPHGDIETFTNPNSSSEQMYTSRHQFGPVQLERDDIIRLAETLQATFKNAKVVISLVEGTEQALYLDGFKKLSLSTQRPSILRLYAREPDIGGIDKIVTLEFGPMTNFGMTQGAVESWTLGELEKIKREVARFERFFVTKNFYIVSFNQILLLAAIVALPSLEDFYKRAIFMAGILTLTLSIHKLHEKFLPNASIRLGPRPESRFWKFLTGPAISWTMAIAAATIATLLATYLSGHLGSLTKLTNGP